jgi:hypothetical protein
MAKQANATPPMPERLQELAGILRHIPKVGAMMKRAFGRGAKPVLDSKDRALMTALFYVAGEVEMLLAATTRIAALEQKLEDIAEKAEVVRAAELDWHAKVPLPDSVLFGNSAGQVAALPLDLLRVYAAKRQLDVTAIVEGKTTVIVKDGERVVVRIPKTLWVCLDKVLDQCSWLALDA